MLVLVLMLDVTHGGAGGHVNEWGDVGATVIEGVGIGVDGVVVTAIAGVEGAGGVGNDDVGIGSAAAVVVVAVGDVGIVGAGVGRTGIVHGIAFAVAVALTFSIGVSVDGASIAGDAGGIDVGIAVAVGIAALVVIIEALVGIDIGIAVCAVAVKTRGQLGVHEVRSAGSSDIEVEGVLLVFERKMLCLISAFRVVMKNGGKVVGWAW